MGSGDMTYIRSLIKIGSGIQKLMAGGEITYRHIDTHTGSKVISYEYLNFFKIRKVN
jgi:hypothetical protein